MVKHVFVFAALILQLTMLSSPLRAGGRKDTDTNPRETRLNKHQLACLAATIKERQRRGWPYRAYQVVITDKGTSYSIAFMEDPLDMTRTGGDGIEWKVRKKDLKLIGPTFYR
jgi:hypothetical protein